MEVIRRSFDVDGFMVMSATHLRRIPALEAESAELRVRVAELEAQRVPLTSEQARTAFLSCMAEPGWTAVDWYYQGLRDSERQHGIEFPRITPE